MDYAAWPDSASAPPRYVLYIEAAPSRPAAEPLGERVERALCAANPAYGGYRAGGQRLGPAVARLVRPGTFNALHDRRVARSPGVGKSQLKTPRLLADEDLRRFLEEASLT